jgi:hypothetical protein
MPTTAVIEKLHKEGSAALITYPERFRSWDAPFDGDEVFSVHTASKMANPFTAVFDVIWSYPAYPQLTLASYFKRPEANLGKFDEVARKQKIGLFAGTDAHSNIGFHLVGDDAGNKLINIKIDPYATTFGIVRMHIFLEKDEPVNRETVVNAVRTGHGFIGFDAFGDSSGFFFSARNLHETGYAGDVIHPFDGVVLTAFSPLAAKFSVYKDGEIFYEGSDTTEISVNATEPGAYRVEVYRTDLGPPFDKMPWIISNPIYVR